MTGAMTEACDSGGMSITVSGHARAGKEVSRHYSIDIRRPSDLAFTVTPAEDVYGQH